MGRAPSPRSAPSSRAAFALVALAAILGPARGARAQCIHSRPTDPGGFSGYVYDTGTAASYGTSRVLVWYATSGQHAPNLASTRTDGVPDDVVYAAEVTDDALAQYAAMGYRAPISDGTYPACASNGGDGRLDVYLMNFTAADGQTVSESCTAAGAASQCASFILAEAKMRSYASWDEAARVVLPHEAFHTVQNAYDAKLDRFWAEGTAQWAAKTLDPALLDLERNLPAFFAASGKSLDAPAGAVTSAYLYGAAIWPVFLTSRYPKEIVREILEQEGAKGGAALAATDAVLTAKHASSLAAEFALFAAWNTATAGRAPENATQDATQAGYANAAKYPAEKLGTLEAGGTASGITSGLGSYAYLLHADAAGAQNVSLETDAARNQGLLVPLEGGHARLDQVKPLPAQAQGDAVVVVAGITTKKTDAPYTLHADPLPGDADAGAPGTSDAAAGAGDATNGGGGSSGCAIARVGSRTGEGAPRGTGAAWLALIGATALFAGRRRARAA
jgi:hypothetical protein